MVHQDRRAAEREAATASNDATPRDTDDAEIAVEAIDASTLTKEDTSVEMQNKTRLTFNSLGRINIF